MLNRVAARKRNISWNSGIFAMLLLAVAGCAAPAGSEAEAASPSRRGGPLAAFHAALDRAEAGGPRVAVLQVGDSHTANDAFSGRMRELIQARAGDGGRGMLPPGVPHDWYRPARITVASDGFRIVRAAPAGLPALRQHADGPASMTLSAEPGELEHTTLELLTQPGGGALDISTSDGRIVRAATDGPLGTRRIQAPTTAATAWVQLAAVGDGPVDMLSWTAERGRGGATWSNLGTVGATMELAQRWDPALAAAEARALQPALVVLAFGTNEGFKDATDLDAYPALVRGAIRRLRAAAPHASIVVAGPPAGVRPLRAGGTACPASPYAVPPNLPRIRAMLRRAAVQEGAAFWDWSEAMGGDCAIVAWSETDPPMAARDHVHLLVPGARQTAEAFFAFLTR